MQRYLFILMALAAGPAAAAGGEWERLLGAVLLLGWGSAESRREALGLLLRLASAQPSPAGHP